MGGLSEEYRLNINIYGKDIHTDEGMKILNKYSDAVYQLLNDNLHIDINAYTSPLLQNTNPGDDTVIVADTPENREMFKPSTSLPDDQDYNIQDNQNTEID